MWIQTATIDYDKIFAATVGSDWAKTHQPVLSKVGMEDGKEVHVHVLYTKSFPGEPDGRLVICPNGCGVDLFAKVRSLGVRFTCPICDQRGTAPISTLKQGPILDHRKLARVPYPQEIYRGISWEPVVRPSGINRIASMPTLRANPLEEATTPDGETLPSAQHLGVSSNLTHALNPSLAPPPRPKKRTSSKDLSAAMQKRLRE
jgi:hypothetical protein